jgi:hypothetical protein
MPRSRYQCTDADVPVVYRWVQAKLCTLIWPQRSNGISSLCWPRPLRLHQRQTPQEGSTAGQQPRPPQGRAAPLSPLRAPFYGVFAPPTRRVYVNDLDNIARVGALLDALLGREREQS